MSNMIHICWKVQNGKAYMYEISCFTFVLTSPSDVYKLKVHRLSTGCNFEWILLPVAIAQTSWYIIYLHVRRIFTGILQPDGHMLIVIALLNIKVGDRFFFVHCCDLYCSDNVACPWTNLCISKEVHKNIEVGECLYLFVFCIHLER